LKNIIFDLAIVIFIVLCEQNKFLKNIIFDLAIVIFIILCYIKYS